MGLFSTSKKTYTTSSTTYNTFNPTANVSPAQEVGTGGSAINIGFNPQVSGGVSPGAAGDGGKGARGAERAAGGGGGITQNVTIENPKGFEALIAAGRGLVDAAHSTAKLTINAGNAAGQRAATSGGARDLQTLIKEAAVPLMVSAVVYGLLKIKRFS